MSEITIDINCCLCSESFETTLELPDKWSCQFGTVSEEVGFCPEHAETEEFFDNQCCGCVGGWGDCDLHQAFAYSHMKLTTQDLDAIRGGICPKRTGGTFSYKDGELSSVDLSDKATTKAGNALADAIEAYCERHHKGEEVTR